MKDNNKISGTFADIIREWVGRNFGSQEMEDPSWNIEALAEHLRNSDIAPDELNATTKSQVYATLDQHYVEEDVENYAETHGYDLSPRQVKSIATEIRLSDWYQSIEEPDMEYYIREERQRG